MILSIRLIQAVRICCSFAQTGQLWLHHNHKRLITAVRAHFGAAINFQAGVLKRAPPGLRAWGLEWLWRIKEEPHLRRSCVYDGYTLLRLLVTRVLPLAMLCNRWRKFRSEQASKGLLISIERCNAVAKLVDDANQRNLSKAIELFRKTLMEVDARRVIDLRATRAIDLRFFGLLPMLRKGLKIRGAKLSFAGVSPKVRRLLEDAA